MYPIKTENDKVVVREEYFTMSDGVRLYTRIVAPKGEDKYPIIFLRTPYEDSHNGNAHNIAAYDRHEYIDNGYAVVIQHCRGRGDSEGVCVPYCERDDGLESLELIRKLDIYNGEIYLCGGSYLSTVHLSYLNTNPSDIKGAILSIQTDRMYFRNYRNGCCYNYCNLGWWLRMLEREFPNPKTEGAYVRPFKDIIKRMIGAEYPAYTNNLINDTYNDFWINDPRTDAIDNLKIPVLFTEGWYDFYIEGMFSMWERLPEETKKRSVFFVGPWGHATEVSKRAEYPLDNGNLPADYSVEWLNSIRNGTPYKYAESGKMRYYSIGEDLWKTTEYPIDNLSKTRFYFGENNSLNEAPTEGDARLTYLYDPEKRLNCFKYHDVYKASAIDSVEGVLSFETKEFEEAASFIGKIRWHMDVSSDCEDTAFFIRVYFVEEDGAYNLTETITSITNLKEDYKAGEKITIDLFTPPIAFKVKKGNKIRVDVSSDGGIYVPHANVKGHWAEVTETKTANNTVYLKDSFIELDTE